MCIKSDAKNRQQCQKWLFSEANHDFSFFASFKNYSLREKVAKLSSFWDWWAESLLASIIVEKYNIFFNANNVAARAKKKVLANRFAHAISVHYRNFEHGYVYWIWLRGSASYVIMSIIKFSTSDNAILASWLVHWISVTSHYTCVWPYMEMNAINVARHKLFRVKPSFVDKKKNGWKKKADSVNYYGQCRPSNKKQSYKVRD